MRAFDHENAIRDSEDLREVGRNDLDGQSLVRQLVDELMNLCDRSHIDATRELIED